MMMMDGKERQTIRRRACAARGPAVVGCNSDHARAPMAVVQRVGAREWARARLPFHGLSAPEVLITKLVIRYGTIPLPWFARAVEFERLSSVVRAVEFGHTIFR